MDNALFKEESLFYNLEPLNEHTDTLIVIQFANVIITLWCTTSRTKKEKTCLEDMLQVN